MEGCIRMVFSELTEDGIEEELAEKIEDLLTRID